MSDILGNLTEWMWQGPAVILWNYTEPHFPDLGYTACSVTGFHCIILIRVVCVLEKDILKFVNNPFFLAALFFQA